MTDEKTERNRRVQERYTELRMGNRHGHYETMFRVVREEIENSMNRIARILGLPSAASMNMVIAEIEKLKANQRLPDYTLGRYQNFCPHNRRLDILCPECHGEKEIK